MQAHFTSVTIDRALRLPRRHFLPFISLPPAFAHPRHSLSSYPCYPSPSHLRTIMYVHSSPLLSPLLTSSPGHLICLVPRPRRRRPSSPRSCSTWPSLASNSVFSPSFVLSSPQSINHDHIYPPRGEFTSFPQWLPRCGVGRAQAWVPNQDSSVGRLHVLESDHPRLQSLVVRLLG